MKIGKVVSTFFKTMFFALLFGMTAFLMVEISQYIKHGDGFVYENFERIAYCMYALCIFSLYCAFGKRMKKWRNKIITASVASVVTTAGVFLLNEYWKYLEISRYDVIIKEFAGSFKARMIVNYIAVLVGMFAACILTSFLVTKIKSVFSNFFTIERFGEKYTLLDYADRYANKADYFEMIDYLQNMPKNEESKSELLRAVNVFSDIQEFYGLLFTVYGDMLTEEEKSALEAKYEKAFNEPWKFE